MSDWPTKNREKIDSTNLLSRFAKDNGGGEGDWYAYCPMRQGSKMYELPKDMGGACFAAVRFWIQLRSGDMDPWDAAGKIMEQWSNICATQGATAFTSGWASKKLNKLQVEGKTMPMTILTRHMENNEGASSGHLGSGVTAILEEIFAEDALYELTVGGATGTGHALGFDTRGGDIFFFDPNLGQAWCVGGGKAARIAFGVWFRNLLWPSMYKDDFTKGRRVLVRFDAKGNARKKSCVIM